MLVRGPTFWKGPRGEVQREDFCDGSLVEEVITLLHHYSGIPYIVNVLCVTDALLRRSPS